MNRVKIAACGLIGLLALPGAATADTAQWTTYGAGAVATDCCMAQMFLGQPCADLSVRAGAPGVGGDTAALAHGLVDDGISALIAPRTGVNIWVVDAGSQFGMDKRIIKKGILPEAVSYQIIPPVGWQNW